jgi:hypothetical protein
MTAGVYRQMAKKQLLIDPLVCVSVFRGFCILLADILGCNRFGDLDIFHRRNVIDMPC